MISSLGVDASVKIEFRNLGRHKASSGFLSRVDASTQKFLTTIKNTKNVPVTIVVGDTVGGLWRVCTAAAASVCDLAVAAWHCVCVLVSCLAATTAL